MRAVPVEAGALTAGVLAISCPGPGAVPAPLPDLRYAALRALLQAGRPDAEDADVLLRADVAADVLRRALRFDGRAEPEDCRRSDRHEGGGVTDGTDPAGRPASHDRRDARDAALARALVGLADTLGQDFDLTDLFDRLATTCVEVLQAATAGVMIADPEGRLQLMASSDAAMRTIERFELDHAEGPCLDSYARQEAVTLDLRDGDARRRWPVFTAAALATGFTAVQALPMRLRDETIGSLNVFHSAGGRRSADDTAVAQALADVTTIAVLQRQALARTEELADQLQTALQARIVIEQAKGVLAERGRLDVDGAFAVLRAYCRAQRSSLTTTAREVVEGSLDADDVLASRWPEHPGR